MKKEKYQIASFQCLENVPILFFPGAPYFNLIRGFEPCVGICHTKQMTQHLQSLGNQEPLKLHQDLIEQTPPASVPVSASQPC